jgi:CHAT domain-containing protein
VQNPLLRSLLVLAGANHRTTEGPVVYRVGEEFVGEAEAKQKLSETELKTARVELGDGFLTAYEAARMNLFGTELVSLTACETGLGTVTADGVAGLRQAFLAAGARSMTMSMFEVPTQETLTQATEFYRRWLGGAGATGSRYEAFRASQQEALQRARTQRQTGHPFFWAGSVYAGDPGDLPMNRKRSK